MVAVGGLGRVVADAGVCRSEAGHLVVELLRVVGGRPQRLAAALGGHSLGVELVVESVGGGRFLVLFSADGAVYRLREDALRRGTFSPHITLRGAPSDLAAVVLGGRDTAEAVFAGTVTIHVELIDDLLPHYPRVLRLVAEELARLLRR